MSIISITQKLGGRCGVLNISARRCQHEQTVQPYGRTDCEDGSRYVRSRYNDIGPGCNQNKYGKHNAACRSLDSELSGRPECRKFSAYISGNYNNHIRQRLAAGVLAGRSASQSDGDPQHRAEHNSVWNRISQHRTSRNRVTKQIDGNPYRIAIIPERGWAL